MNERNFSGLMTTLVVRTLAAQLSEEVIENAVAAIRLEMAAHQVNLDAAIEHQLRQRMICDACGHGLAVADVLHGCSNCGEPVIPPKRLVAIGVSEKGEPFHVETAGHRGWWRGDFSDVLPAEDRDDYVGA
jgi:hypothetical protein